MFSEPSTVIDNVPSLEEFKSDVYVGGVISIQPEHPPADPSVFFTKLLNLAQFERLKHEKRKSLTSRTNVS